MKELTAQLGAESRSDLLKHSSSLSHSHDVEAHDLHMESEHAIRVRRVRCSSRVVVLVVVKNMQMQKK